MPSDMSTVSVHCVTVSEMHSDVQFTLIRTYFWEIFVKKITNRHGEQRRDWIPNPRCHSAAWVRPASLIEKKLKDVGFFSPLLSVVTKKKEKPLREEKHLFLIWHYSWWTIRSMLEKGNRTDSKCSLQWEEISIEAETKWGERKRGIGEDTNCFQGERRHGHSVPGCSLLH